MSHSEIRNAIVLVIDGLGPTLLGAYGNTWFETENLNRLASRSVLFDQSYVSSPQLEKSYQSFWNSNLKKSIADSGVVPTLLTDDPKVESFKTNDLFDQIIQVGSSSQSQTADSIEQTELANFFSQAILWLSEMEPGSLGWLHSRGLLGTWDAPFETRLRLADADDPEPPKFHEPPVRTFDPEKDEPDDLLGYQQACAAQVILIDQFLGVVLDLMENNPIWQSTMLCLTSTRGYPNGEHGLVGHHEYHPSLFNEVIHVPMMVCLPQTKLFHNYQSIRNGSLVQTDWISDCLIDWFDEDESKIFERMNSATNSLPNLEQEALIIRDGDLRSIQTHAWKLISNSEKSELYAKPDDRSEVNDVSRRCPQVVESLEAILDQCPQDGDLGKQESFKLPELLSRRLN